MKVSDNLEAVVLKMNKIKETPVLYGKDAKKFISDNREVKKITVEERQRIQSNYEALKSIAKFQL